MREAGFWCCRNYPEFLELELDFEDDDGGETDLCVFVDLFNLPRLSLFSVFCPEA